MYTWITQNIGTILISLAFAAVIIGIIVYLRRQKKKGTCSCGCSCSECSACPHADPKKDNK